ncbi:hypothetical protein VHEMI01666 [[Torrubiella] hemipterigena]|uniref:Uncharacterized protein n=1 Tax=[Torrubiella] hemipterigena TaxID=1531966 RepID=A0A0A1T5Z5_9HYPO|nr:hypothetical protein VHEMI01666 [[Torrubiella] hemipterigena]
MEVYIKTLLTLPNWHVNYGSIITTFHKDDIRYSPQIILVNDYYYELNTPGSRIYQTLDIYCQGAFLNRSRETTWVISHASGMEARIFIYSKSSKLFDLVPVYPINNADGGNYYGFCHNVTVNLLFQQVMRVIEFVAYPDNTLVTKYRRLANAMEFHKMTLKSPSLAFDKLKSYLAGPLHVYESSVGEEPKKDVACKVDELPLQPNPNFEEIRARIEAVTGLTATRKEEEPVVKTAVAVENVMDLYSPPVDYKPVPIMSLLTNDVAEDSLVEKTLEEIEGTLEEIKLTEDDDATNGELDDWIKVTDDSFDWECVDTETDESD